MNISQNTDQNSVEFAALFADLIAQHGEQNGGSEDFYIHSEGRIGCRYADVFIHKEEDGWHYGPLPEAYRTPAECYAHWWEDYGRFLSANNQIRPFDSIAQVLANLMEARGFRVSRGTYHHGNGDILPTWVIDRPDTPEWNGVWQPWEAVPEMVEAEEAQTLFALCGAAIAKWDEVAWMYEDDPNDQDQP